MPPGFGRDSFIGWGLESTFGTAVAATKFAELLGDSLSGEYSRKPRPVFRGMDPRESNLYDELFKAGGSFSIEASYEGLTRLLEHAWGLDTVTTVETSVRFQHLYAFQEAELKSGTGLTFHIGRGLGQQMRIKGGKIASMKFVMTPDRLMQIEAGIFGQLMEAVSDSTPTFPSSALYVAGHQCITKIDTVARPFDSLELSFNNGIEENKRVLGSKSPAEPVRSNTMRSITGTIVVDGDIADFNKYAAGTLFQLDAQHTGPTLGAGTYLWNFSAAKCRVTADPLKVGGPGIVKATIPFEVLRPTAGVATMMTATLVNGESAIA